MAHVQKVELPERSLTSPIFTYEDCLFDEEIVFYTECKLTREFPGFQTGDYIYGIEIDYDKGTMEFVSKDDDRLGMFKIVLSIVE